MDAATGLGASAAAAATLVIILGFARIGYGFFDVSDIGGYADLADRVASGLTPYVDFGVEYPPLAALLFTIPPVGGGSDQYAVVFAAMMLGAAACSGAAVTVAARQLWPGRGRAVAAASATHALAILAAGAIVANRYDAAVALVVAASLLAVAMRRVAVAAAVLGLGFALKLTPAILLPVVLVTATSRRSLGVAMAAFGACAVAPWLLYLPGGAEELRQVFGYHLARPLQIESVLATPLLVARIAGSSAVSAGSSFGSQHVAGPGAGLLAAVSGPLALAGLGAVGLLCWRRRAALRAAPRLVPLAALATLLVALACGKVLSPQYFVWLLPAVALVAPERPWLAGATVALALLTQIEFPALYWRFVAFEPGPVAIVVVRNVLLLGVAAWSVVELARAPGPSSRELR